MIFLFCFKSLPYLVVKSPFITEWAFLMIFHVSRLLFDQCSTLLISSINRKQF